MKKSVCVVLLAAGKGVRLKSPVPKPLVKVSGKPMVQYSLETFQGIPAVTDIVLVVSKRLTAQIAAIVRKVKADKVRAIVFGGKERQDSVRNGLAKVPAHCALVAIHDCARPLVDARTVKKLIEAAARHKAAIVAVPVKATVKKVSAGKVLASLDRKSLWEVQTPQVFDRNILEQAFEKFGSIQVTDDAMLVEKSGVAVYVIEGSYRNIKVTTPEDIIVAEALLKAKR